MEIITKSAQETKELGRKIGIDLITRDEIRDTRYVKDSAVVFALSGDLGSGKTTFVQGLAKGLGIKQRIVSPTFIIVREYKIRETRGGKRVASNASRLSSFYHIDLYRLEKDIKQEMRNLGIDEIWEDPSNILVIEWAEKARKAIPNHARWIKFKNMGRNKRKIKIS